MKRTAISYLTTGTWAHAFDYARLAETFAPRAYSRYAASMIEIAVIATWGRE